MRCNCSILRTMQVRFSSILVAKTEGSGLHPRARREVGVCRDPLTAPAKAATGSGRSGSFDTAVAGERGVLQTSTAAAAASARELVIIRIVCCYAETCARPTLAKIWSRVLFQPTNASMADESSSCEARAVSVALLAVGLLPVPYHSESALRGLVASLHADVFAMTEPDPRSDSQLSQPTSQLELSVTVLSKLATALPRNLKGVALTSLPLAMRLRHLHPATAWSHVPSARGSGRRSPLEKGARTMPTRAYGGRAPTRPVLCCRRAAVVPRVARVEADGAGRRLTEEGQLRDRGQDPL